MNELKTSKPITIHACTPTLRRPGGGMRWRCAAILLGRLGAGGRYAAAIAIVASVLAWAPRAGHTDNAALDVNRFHPALGSSKIMVTELASVGPHLEIVPQLFLHYAHRPMVFTVGGEQQADVVSARWTSELGLALALRERVQLGLSFPVTLMQDGDPLDIGPVYDADTMQPVSPPSTVSSTGLEDLRLSVKGLAWRNQALAVGGSAVFGVPTGSAESYLGTGAPWLDMRVLGHFRSGRFTASANLGWLFAAKRQIFDTRSGMGLTFGGGMEYEVYRDAEPQVDTSVALASEVVGLAHSRFESMRETPIEALGAVKVRIGQWTVFVGGGFGVTSGYGEPVGRGLAGVSYSWKPTPRSQVTPVPKPAPAVVKVPPPVQEPPAEEPPKQEWEGDTRELQADVLFAFGKCAITPESYAVLRKLAEEFKANPEWGNIRVEGHADSVDTDKYNLHLSRCRAARVVRFLVHHGVNPKRLSYVGFGERCARAGNNTPEERQRNRRVEFVRNQENNPPRCEVPPQLEPLPQHAAEPDRYLQEGAGTQPQPSKQAPSDPSGAAKPAAPAPAGTSKPAAPAPAGTSKPAAPAPAGTSKPTAPAAKPAAPAAKPAAPAPAGTGKPAAPAATLPAAQPGSGTTPR